MIDTIYMPLIDLMRGKPDPDDTSGNDFFAAMNIEGGDLQEVTPDD